jgi:hypothetical protein
MNRSRKSSSLEILFQCLSKLWEPAGEAFHVQNELGILSLEETRPALECAGYEISHVDLPERVSGFAEIIADKPHIILNRQQSPQNLQYTVPHELGHHILHLSSAPKHDPLGFPGVGDKELEADLFATSWLMVLGNDKQRNEALPQNPESSRALVIYLLLTLVLVFATVMMHLFLQPAPESK